MSAPVWQSVKVTKFFVALALGSAVAGLVIWRQVTANEMHRQRNLERVRLYSDLRYLHLAVYKASQSIGLVPRISTSRPNSIYGLDSDKQRLGSILGNAEHYGYVIETPSSLDGRPSTTLKADEMLLVVSSEFPDWPPYRGVFFDGIVKIVPGGGGNEPNQLSPEAGMTRCREKKKNESEALSQC